MTSLAPQNQAPQLDTNKRHCLICKKQTFPHYLCACGGGGGGDAEPVATQTDHADASRREAKLSLSEVKAQVTEDSDEIESILHQLELRFDERVFNLEIIQELFAKKIIELENNPEFGALTLKFLYTPKRLPHEYQVELQRYLTTLLKEYQQFKQANALRENGVSMETDKDGNLLSLRIVLPTYKLYQAFVNGLMDKNLLPQFNLTNEAKQAVNPFDTKLAPGMKRSAKPEEEEENKKESKPKQEPQEAQRNPHLEALLKLRPRGLV